MKNQKGFIQIPILMGIVFGVIAIGVGSYFVTQKISEASKNKSIKNEAIAVNANQKVESVAGVATGNQGATNADQAATSTAEVPSEVDQLKKEVAVLKKEQDAQPKIIEKIIEKPVAMENSPVNNAPISSTVVVTPTAATNQVDQQAQNNARRNQYGAINVATPPCQQRRDLTTRATTQPSAKERRRVA